MDDRPPGSGPGAITPDGCAVEVYARLPPGPELELIAAALPARADLLDLGSGTGRLAVPLARRGHRVLMVDESEPMLRRALAAAAGLRPGAVRARIQDLRLGTGFTAVLLASHLVNTDDPQLAAALLRTCRRSVRPDGQVLVQWHPPEWFDALAAGDRREGRIGPVLARLEVLGRDAQLLSAVVRYELDGQVWAQRFTARRLDRPGLDRILAASGLVRLRWLDSARTWFAAGQAG